MPSLGQFTALSSQFANKRGPIPVNPPKHRSTKLVDSTARSRRVWCCGDTADVELGDLLGVVEHVDRHRTVSDDREGQYRERLLAVERNHAGRAVDERWANVGREAPGAQMIGCEYCVDLGSQICRNSGLSDEELLALPGYRQSDLFTDREKLALDYTVAVMSTPVEVTDELFDLVKEQFNDKQIVEITALLTVVNIDRFNAAFGIGSAGFSEGMVCVPPDRPAAAKPALARIA